MTLSITAQQPTTRSVILVLQGDLDHRGAVDLRAAVTAAAGRQPTPHRIVVDLRGVAHVDEMGVGTLVVGARICRDLGIDLAVRHPLPLVRRVLGQTGVPAQSSSSVSQKSRR